MVDGLAGFDMGQDESMSYFHTGEAGYHKQWDSRCFCYRLVFASFSILLLICLFGESSVKVCKLH